MSITAQLSIGICTRERPVGLRALLSSMVDLSVPDGVIVRIDVVENGPGVEGKLVIESLKDLFDLPIHYHREPRLGIPFARNRLLDNAIANCCDAIIFVDDDEVVESSWLVALCARASQVGSETVIQGKVVSELPDDCDPIIASMFNQRQRSDGELLTSAASNNVFVPLDIVRKHGIYFDESMANTGGTDTVFFARARNAGYPILYCEEAVVREAIPKSRLTLRWLGKRKFRVGLLQGSGRIVGKPGSIPKMVFYGLRAFISLVTFLVFSLLLQRRLAVKSWLSACKYAGIAAGRVLRLFPVYERVDGG